MNILYLNTYSNGGGAAIAAKRMMMALSKNEGHDVRMLTLDGLLTIDNDNVSLSKNQSLRYRITRKLIFFAERLAIYIANGFDRKHLFKVSLANRGFNIASHPLIDWADVIHLHWINQGFLSIRELKKLLQMGKPIVWTMHDFWPMTGICHIPLYYNDSPIPIYCNRYEQSCGKCPILSSTKVADLSHRLFVKKKQLVSQNISYLAVSTWLAKAANKSNLLKNATIGIIPNTFDPLVFSPKNAFDQETEVLLQREKFPIVMSAARLDDEVKGFNMCIAALNLFAERYPELSNSCCFVPIGAIKNNRLLSQINMPVYHIQKTDNMNKLAAIYTRAKVTISTSFIETFGQTIVEALACGSPVVSFGFGGQQDIIRDTENGFLVQPYDIDAMADAIAQAIEMGLDEEKRDFCIKSVEKYQDKEVAKLLSDFYIKLIANKDEHA